MHTPPEWLRRLTDRPAPKPCPFCGKVHPGEAHITIVILPDPLADLIESAAQAQELFGDDEFERFTAELRNPTLH